MSRRGRRVQVASGHPRLRRTRVAVSFVLSWGLLGLLLGTYWLTTDGEHGRVRVMTVLTGSMRPTLGVGDLVIAEVVPAEEIRPGDIVTYREPTGERLVTHRVQSVLWTGTLGSVITRGDANEVGETWTIESDGALGRVALHVPGVGYAVGALTTVPARLALTAAAVVLGAYALLLIWRPRREDMTKRVLLLLQDLDTRLSQPAPAATGHEHDLDGDELLALGELLPLGDPAPVASGRAPAHAG